MRAARHALLCLCLCLCLCAWSVPALAAEALIVSESDRSSHVVQKLRTEPVAGVRTAAGYPKVMRTDDLPGLKPGRLVTVVGICADRKSARRVVEALRGTLAVSRRTVEGDWPDACPSTDPPPPTSPTEARLLERLEKDPGSQDALYEYAQYLQMAGRLDEAMAQLDKLLALNPDHTYAKELRAVILVLQAGP